MESNGIKYAAGALIIGAALLSIWAIMTWEFQGEFPENEFTIEVCNCDTSVTTDEIESELGSLLRFIEKDDKSGAIDFVVPRVISGKESFLIPQVGMSWFSMQFAPVTYRMEYRHNDEAQFFKKGKSGSDMSLGGLSTSFLNSACDSSNAYDFTFFVERQLSRTVVASGTYNNVDSLRDKGLIPMVNSGRIDAGSRIRVEFGCRGSYYGCTDEGACNFSSEAKVDDGTCLVLDECGVCGGGGIVPGTCDCSGRVPKTGYDCAGNCLDPTSSKCDADNDGVPDAFDVCPDTKAQVTGGNGCEFRVALPLEGQGAFTLTGKKDDQLVRVTIKSKTGKVLTVVETPKAVFPFDPTESKELQRSLAYDVADLELKFEVLDSSESKKVIWTSAEKKNLNMVCTSRGLCEFQQGTGVIQL
jgi:hypothetical protein